MAQVDGINGKAHTVKIGDSIGFKQDVEQYGTVTDIKGAWITLSVSDGMTGEESQIEVHCTSAWYEG